MPLNINIYFKKPTKKVLIFLSRFLRVFS